MTDTTENPMRERIARAICAEIDLLGTDDGWRGCLDVADAVLDAMREPSEQVVKYAAMAVRDFYTEDGPYPRTKAMWKAAIDAAKEGK